MSEQVLNLELELLDDAVFSERAASVGAHAGLDYVPGSALLGWAARHLYASLDACDAWLLFHSGKVRFGNALPLTANGLIAYPSPLSLHFHKSKKWREEDGRARPDTLLNLARATMPGGEQWQQLRNTWLTSDGSTHQPTRELSMKTAIDPSTGRAAQSQLYGYDALRAGQRFVARIEVDADVSESLFGRLCEVFADTIAHLGRSRSSQYGRITCRLREQIAPPACDDAAPSRELLLWLLSDMAILRDGRPVFAPCPEDLGLPSGRLVRERSFIRARAFSPYNTHRRTPDIERQLIMAGSVLFF